MQKHPNPLSSSCTDSTSSSVSRGEEEEKEESTEKIYINATLSSHLNPVSENKQRKELPKQAEGKKDLLLREKSLLQASTSNNPHAEDSKMKGKYFSS